MAVLWSLTCAAAILSLLQENNLSNSSPHRLNVGQQQLTIFTVSRNLKNDKNYFIKVKLYKLTQSVISHQTLFQYQLGYVWPTV